MVDAERRSWVKGIYGCRGPVFLSDFVSEDHADRNTADVHPVGQLFVESVFALGSHIFIQCIHIRRNIIFSAVGHITDWAIQKVSRLEYHDFVRPVNHHLVVDLRSNDFVFQADVLFASVIVIQIGHFCPVDAMHGQCFAQHLHHIFRGNFLFCRVDFTPTSHPINRPLRYSSNSIVFSHLITSRQTKMPTNYRGFLGN